jgi:thiamine-triphosphatase
MIEIEKKFLLSEKDEKRLIKDAEFISKKEFVDIYYDDKFFSLTKNDIWLRSRDNDFELKLPLNNKGNRTADKYKEITNEKIIKKFLKLNLNKNLKSSLKEAGYLPFVKCKTIRKKYKKDKFIIDIDYVDFGNFNYNICEIELMLNKKSEIKNAVNQIINFALEHNLKITPVRGKIIEYLKRKRPKHYKTLVLNKVVEDF